MINRIDLWSLYCRSFDRASKRRVSAFPSGSTGKTVQDENYMKKLHTNSKLIRPYHQSQNLTDDLYSVECSPMLLNNVIIGRSWLSYRHAHTSRITIYARAKVRWDSGQPLLLLLLAALFAIIMGLTRTCLCTGKMFWKPA
jgi:hypothetical protein